ncbi:MAG: site-2 protease family protein, partial [Acidimicrobiales bacterium]
EQMRARMPRHLESLPPEQVGAISAAGNAVTTEVGLMGDSLIGIRTFFAPSNIRDFGSRVFASPGADDSELSPESRPVSIVGIVDYGAQGGSQSAWNIVWLLAYFNVFIGVFNLLPVPPLDGGHVVIALYEAVRSKLTGRRHRVNTERLIPVIYGVIGVLVFFGLGAIYLDVADSILGG